VIADGLRIRLDILEGNQIVPGAMGLTAVAVAGTVAHAQIQAVAPGDIIEFQALIRMRLPAVLDQLSATAREISLPVEFVLLDLESR
jgi:hypothetical protein